MLRGYSLKRCILQSTNSSIAKCQQRYIQRFAVGNHVWIHCGDNAKPHWRQIPAQDGLVYTRNGPLTSKSIVDCAPGELVKLSSGSNVRLTHPTLEEHILYVERTVTPIYPRDATLIVSRLDLHPEHPSPDAEPAASDRIEILEAGTGMGGLTLHLARALHAGNPSASEAVRRAATEAFSSTLSESDADAVRQYKTRRQAVVHTVEVDENYAIHAAKVIGSFRNGLYAPTIDQHVGDVSAWIEGEFRRRYASLIASSPPAPTNSPNPLAPFLNHIILDLPDAQQHVAMAERALRLDGLLVLFVPSISQVQDAVLRVRATRLSLFLDDVLEIGTNMSGGRQWAVELARIRKTASELAEDEDDLSAMKTEAETSEDDGSFIRSHPSLPSQKEGTSTNGPGGYASSNSAEEQFAAAFAAARAAPSTQREAAFGLVTRPRTVNMGGGGFLAFFRKVEGDATKQLRRGDWFRGKRDKVYRVRRTKEKHKQV